MDEFYIPYKPTEKQAMFHQSPAYEVLFGGAAGPGKLLHVDTPIPTTRGWVPMGEIAVGDLVFGPDGHPCRVTMASAVQVKPAYRLTFDDGATLDAHDEHLWHTYTAKDLEAMTRRTDAFRERRRATRESRVSGKKSAKFTQSLIRRNQSRDYDLLPPPEGAVRTTQEIVDTLKVRGNRANHAIPVTEPLQLPEADLPLDPYLLGLWLGDGSTSSGHFTSMDGLEQVFADHGYLVKKLKRPAEHYIRGMVPVLREIGVFGNKHIPDTYLWTSQEQRLALLQGLMDTDGSCDRYGCAEFTNKNKELAEGVAFLARSLGMKAVIREGKAKLNGRDCGPKYRVGFTTTTPVFRVERKRERQPQAARRTTRFRYIVSAQRLPDAIPMKCIAIDSPSHLYLAGDHLIATHNTTAAVIDAYARCYHHPGTVAYILRRTRPELMKSVVPEALKWYPKGSYVYNIADGVINLPNGSMIHLVSCQHEKDKYNFQGAQIDWLYFEELTHFTKSIYDYLKTRVRTSKAKKIQPCIRCTSNPGGLGHGWVKKYFVDAGPFTSLIPVKTWVDSRRRFEVMTKQYIPALVTENPHINDSYIRELEQKPESLRRALLLGEWDAFEGQVFIEFTDDPSHYMDRKNTHVIEPFDIPDTWKRYRGFDWGYVTPFAVIWAAVSPDKRVYVYREYYGSATGDNVGLYDAKTKRYKVHVAYVAGDAMLYCSETARPQGMYAHGMYPFVFDTYTRVFGRTHGNGMVDELMEMQRSVNRYAKYIDDNARMNSKLRMLLSDAADINAEDLEDLSKQVIKAGGGIGDNNLRWFPEVRLSPAVQNNMYSFINMMKDDTGQSAFTRGEVTGGVTARSAITALQEAGGKISRFRTEVFKYGFKDGVEQILWLIKQFYKKDRIVAIVGEDGELKEIKAGELFDKGDLMPYAVRIQTQRRNPMRVQAENDLMMQLFNAMAQQNQTLDVDIMIRLLQVDGKDRFLKAIEKAREEQALGLEAQNAVLQQDNQALQEQVAMVKQMMAQQASGLAQTGAEIDQMEQTV